jgi:hypothetical protein
MIGIAEEFPCPFGDSIRGDGLDMKIVFGEGDSLVLSIDGRGGGEDKLFDPKFFTDL